MSCADINCSSKNISKTLRTRCCSGGRSITPTQRATPKSIAQRALEGEKPEERPPSIFNKVIDPSRQTEEEKASRTSTPIIAGGQPATSEPGDVDSDCNSWGWFKFICVGGKSTIKGWNDCGGTGIPCGYLIIGAIAVVLVMQVIR